LDSFGGACSAVRHMPTFLEIVSKSDRGRVVSESVWKGWFGGTTSRQRSVLVGVLAA